MRLVIGVKSALHHIGDERMKPLFREDKATQAACIFIAKEGGTINYMKLLKLLYLADRQRLLERGCPITYDSFSALKHGPILSYTYNLINHGVSPGVDSYWLRHISAPENYNVSLKAQDFSFDSLSCAELKVLDDIYEKLGHLDEWGIVDWCHNTENVPEWKSPGESSKPIHIYEILEAEGKTPMEIIQIEKELSSVAQFEKIIST